mgnify:CR=1 FL=1
MAQAKQTFIGSKMNRDKDARLVPKGEYREGKNINVSRSEGADVGALENMLGNSAIPVFSNLVDQIQAAIGANNVLSVIGMFPDNDTASVFVFLTSFRDNSLSQSIKFKGFNYLIRLREDNNVFTANLLLKGKFLNFSKASPILSCDIIENLLFWTDNRNQPRKINLGSAYVPGDFNSEPTASSCFYFCEDHISVAKYAPVEPIRLIKNIGSESNPDYQPTWKCEDEEWLPVSLTAPVGEIADDAQPEINFAPPAASTTWPQWNVANPISLYVIRTAGNDSSV